MLIFSMNISLLVTLYKISYIVLVISMELPRITIHNFNLNIKLQELITKKMEYSMNFKLSSKFLQKKKSSIFAKSILILITALEESLNNNCKVLYIF